jgi:hypothetical protein
MEFLLNARAFNRKKAVAMVGQGNKSPKISLEKGRLGRRDGDDGTNECSVEQKIKKDNGKNKKNRKSRLWNGLHLN